MQPLRISLLFLAGFSSANAALLVYEPFNYTAGAAGLSGANGGTGFSGAWSNNNQAGTPQSNVKFPSIVAPTLNYTDPGSRTLVTSGKMLFLDSTSTSTATTTGTLQTSPYRNLGATLDVTTSSTLYLSLLGQQTAGNPRAFNLALFASGANSGTSAPYGFAERVTVGHGTNTPASGPYTWDAYNLGNGTNGSAAGSGGVSSNLAIDSAAFLVLRIDLNQGGTAEHIRLYVNPSLDAEPGTAVVDYSRDVMASFGDIDFLRPFAGRSDGTYAAANGLMDEIRLGTTWADVTPFTIPEPSITGVLTGASLLVFRRRRDQARSA